VWPRCNGNDNVWPRCNGTVTLMSPKCHPKKTRFEFSLRKHRNGARKAMCVIACECAKAKSSLSRSSPTTSSIYAQNSETIITLHGYISVNAILAHNPPLSNIDLSVGMLKCLQTLFFFGDETCSPSHQNIVNHRDNKCSSQTFTITFL
jgi:hypothetical protein